MVSCGILIIILIIVAISSVFRGCFGTEPTSASVSTETKPSNNVQTTTAPQTTKEDDLSPAYFKTPKIEDDNTNGTMSYGIYGKKKPTSCLEAMMRGLKTTPTQLTALLKS